MLQVYTYNDLPHSIETPGDTLVKKKIRELLTLLEKLLSENKNVHLIDEAFLVEELIKKIPAIMYDVTLGIGPSGYQIARVLEEKTKKFGNIQLLPVQRREKKDGEYAIIHTDGKTLHSQIKLLKGKNIAIVEDTIYSGQTIVTLLHELPLPIRNRTHVFCLQAIQESTAKIKEHTNFYPAVLHRGKINTEITIIKASGLFKKGSIRKIDGTEMAFYQRPEWIRAWFPKNADRIIVLCQELAKLSL